MLIRCEECGKFFGSETESNNICSSCKQGEVTGLKHIKDPEEQRFVVARNLVYENPDISPDVLVKAMQDMGIEVTIKDIMRYVREGRLTLKNAEIENICEDCGKRILSGRKCPTCTKAFEETIAKTMKEVKKEVQEDKIKDENKKKQTMYSQESKK